MTSQRRLGAVVGVVAAGLGLGVSELVSGYLHQRVSPVGAVAESVVRLTPGAVVEKVISIVGRNDKPLVIGATLLGLLLVSAAVGVVAERSLALAQAAFLAMGLVLGLAVRARLTSSQATYLPALVGVAVAMLALAMLTSRARLARLTSADVAGSGGSGSAVSARPGSAADAATSRRDVVRLLGVVAGGALVVGVAGRVLAHGRAALDSARTKLRLPASTPVEPAGVELAVQGIAPWNTSQQDFYRIDTALSIPQILPEDWTLRIHGMVDRELTLTYQDLLDRGLTEAWMTLCCVSNQVGGDLISNAWWSGVRIADLLAESGVQPGADAVFSRSDDDWTCGTPLEALTDDRNAMLAVAMNGEPLTPEHGFPVRMVVPGLYGYVSATKWVVDMEVTRFADFTAFWTQRGWSAQGPVKTESRIDVPSSGGQVSAGQVAVGGVAWAQHTGISAVEVRIDEGDWVRAELGADPTIDSWVQWSYVWAADPGKHQLQVRATDKSGYTQTGDQADVVPNGATGWHTVEVQVA